MWKHALEWKTKTAESLNMRDGSFKVCKGVDLRRVGCVRGITQSAAACKNLTIIKEEWLLLTMIQLPLA